MTAPSYLPCEPWATQADLCSPFDDYALDSALMDDMLEVASFLLYMASGQQFHGECEETIRPCSQQVSVEAGANPLIYRTPFPFSYACGCGERSSCSCTRLQSIELPHYPVNAVSSVKVDGVTLATTAYRVDAWHYLVRLDGETWPCCPDLSLPTTEEDTFEVSYTWGMPLPPGAALATATLAGELYQSCNPEGFETECRLPRNIASLARQGVTMAFQLVDELFSPRDGKPISFGIPEIDIFLAVTNPHGATSPGVLLSPDDPDLARRVGT